MATIIRKKRGLQIAGFAALVASAAMVQSVAAQADSVIVEVGECVDLPTPEQRLACFEARVDAARTAPSGAGAAATSSTAPADFGFPEQQEAEREPEVPPEINAKVAELRETVPNAYLITLDNGQVWRQTQPKYGYALRPGNDVRIYSSRIRSFRLETPQQAGYIQVERVR